MTQQAIADKRLEACLHKEVRLLHKTLNETKATAEANAAAAAARHDVLQRRLDRARLGGQQALQAASNLMEYMCSDP